MPLFRWRFEGEDLEREVEVDNVGISGDFLLTKKGPVTEFIPGRLLAMAQVIEEDESGES